MKRTLIDKLLFKFKFIFCEVQGITRVELNSLTEDQS